MCNKDDAIRHIRYKNESLERLLTATTNQLNNTTARFDKLEDEKKDLNHALLQSVLTRSKRDKTLTFGEIEQYAKDLKLPTNKLINMIDKK